MDPMVFRWLFDLTQGIQRAASLIGHTLVMQNSEQPKKENIQEKDEKYNIQEKDQRLQQAEEVKQQETKQFFSEKKEEQVDQVKNKDRCLNIIDISRLLGFQQYFKERKHLYGDLSYREKMKKAGKEWQTLSFEEKSKYESLNSKVMSCSQRNELKQGRKQEKKQTKLRKHKEKVVDSLQNFDDSLKEEK
ncbi:hypothetical protein pb186bvf_007434 [Paramecium bursaria]